MSVGSESGRPAASTDDFAGWVAPHLAALWAVAAHEVGAGTADDVVQESLLRAWRKWSSYDPRRGTPRAWLVAVLVDRSRRYRVRRRPGPVAVPLDPAGVVRDPAERLAVEQAVRQLPPRQRQVVVLHYLADLSVGEVASLLEISEGAVKAQLFDARARLRRILGEDDA